MSEKTKLVKLTFIRSQVYDTYGELVLRVPADATTEEILELGGEKGVEWRCLLWDQRSQPTLSLRVDDPLCIDPQVLVDVHDETITPHGVLLRKRHGWLELP